MLNFIKKLFGSEPVKQVPAETVVEKSVEVTPPFPTETKPLVKAKSNKVRKPAAKKPVAKKAPAKITAEKKSK